MAGRKKPRAIDLFAGAGGLTEGLRLAGFRVVGAVELDPLACASYRLNHRRTVLWQTDIRRLTGPAMLKKLGLQRGELDLLAACPPCQGFSTLRTSNGTRKNRDPRNGLIGEVLRLIRSLVPKSVMLENVPGLSTSTHYAAFRRALRRLGYKVQWKILNVADFGVPQRRRRLILIASKTGSPRFADPDPVKRTVRDAIKGLRAPAKERKRKNADALHGYRIELSDKVKQLIRRIPKNGGSRSALDERSQLTCHKGFDGYRDTYGRMAWNNAAPTITGGCINPSKGRFLHPSHNRPITLREAALLQSFRPDYAFSLAKGRYAVALLIGNALPPEFIKRHAVALSKSGSQVSMST